jgi:hypothetical protein
MISIRGIGSGVAASLAGQLLYSYGRSNLTQAVSSCAAGLLSVAKYSGAAATIAGGYVAASAVYQGEYKGLHDYLWLTRDWEIEDAERAVNRVRTAATLITFAASFAPLAYLALS